MRVVCREDGEEDGGGEGRCIRLVCVCRYVGVYCIHASLSYIPPATYSHIHIHTHAVRAHAHAAFLHEQIKAHAQRVVQHPHIYYTSKHMHSELHSTHICTSQIPSTCTASRTAPRVAWHITYHAPHTRTCIMPYKLTTPMDRNSRFELNICARLGSAPLNNSVANGLYSVALQLNRMYP